MDMRRGAVELLPEHVELRSEQPRGREPEARSLEKRVVRGGPEGPLRVREPLPARLQHPRPAGAGVRQQHRLRVSTVGLLLMQRIVPNHRYPPFVPLAVTR